jgi:hypothetical protein
VEVTGKYVYALMQDMFVTELILSNFMLARQLVVKTPIPNLMKIRQKL